MMKRKKFLLAAISFIILLGLQLGVTTVFGQPPGQRPPLPPVAVKGDTTHSLSIHFTPSSNSKKTTDPKGFIQRWMVLEPVRKDIMRNSIFTDKYLKATFAADNFSDDYNTVPKNGEQVKVGGEELKWYALDSKTFNFNLYNFTYALNKAPYGVLFWLVTVIDCPQEIKNVRMAAGTNSAGMFWLNGAEALILSGDRDMIVDNVTSQRLTLKKGKNIIRGAVINGPGMCNFCFRFLDEKGLPVKNFTISYQ
ncbi:MAG: hypothetical protein ABI091_30795 [Ferruginibacter sp.]